ncbi:hypothetical protein AC578_10276 [Pseudocercospora eumusae]|uniref:Heterokaryon incompatibility domain-containing protein n=1 Tax=Pseudocercospora eumusae TaxID=321146 RepID=A0A139HRG8_9PEZI|nr:hypothetical protein AC578_10276 [Pseudocercospora eumusae]
MDDRPEAQRSTAFYQTIMDWQTRILVLEPGERGTSLNGRLEVVDVILAEGVVLHRQQVRIRYSALSYCWTSMHRSHSIVCNGQRMAITASLYGALDRLRDPNSPTYVWADALCINQDDTEERSTQVNNMLSIFSKAEKVVVWLGEYAALQSLDLLVLKNELWEILWTIEDPVQSLQFRSTVMRTCKELVDAPWFHRIWVLQEVWSAAHIVVLYNDAHTSWTTLLQVIDRASDVWTAMARRHDRRRHDPGQESWQNPFALISNRFLRPKPGHRALIVASGQQKKFEYLQELHAYGQNDIVRVLRRSVGCQCSDLRDHVYGVIGMSTDANIPTRMLSAPSETISQNHVMIDYHMRNTVAMVFEHLTRYLIQRDGNVNILLLNATFGGTIDAQNVLSSWVPDWRCMTADGSWLGYARDDFGYHVSSARRPHEHLAYEPETFTSWSFPNAGCLVVHGWAVGVVGMILPETVDEPSAVLHHLPQDLEMRFEALAMPQTLQSTALIDAINFSLSKLDSGRITTAHNAGIPLAITIRLLDRNHQIDLDLRDLEFYHWRRVPAWNPSLQQSLAGLDKSSEPRKRAINVADVAYANLKTCPDSIQHQIDFSRLKQWLRTQSRGDRWANSPTFRDAIMSLLTLPTEEWFLSLTWAVPSHARSGDLVLASPDIRLPIVLRPRHDLVGSMEYIGPCTMADVSPREVGLPQKHWTSDQNFFASRFVLLSSLLEYVFLSGNEGFSSSGFTIT